MNIARKPPCRLNFVFAAKAPVAVILRRGPTRSVKMIIWHTNTDRFEDGEWWRGRVYEDKCGLSPDGRLFVYFGYQWKPRYIPEGVFAFSAVSRPPTFKPIALWPSGDTWGGGGYFPDNKRLVLNYGAGVSTRTSPLLSSPRIRGGRASKPFRRYSSQPGVPFGSCGIPRGRLAGKGPQGPTGVHQGRSSISAGQEPGNLGARFQP